MKTSEKVAYIKGLMEGLEIDTTKPENKILKEVVTVLEELAASNNVLTEENIKLRDYIEEIDSDLGDLEEYVYDIDGYDDYTDDDDDEYEYGEEESEEDGEEEK